MACAHDTRSSEQVISPTVPSAVHNSTPRWHTLPLAASSRYNWWFLPARDSRPDTGRSFNGRTRRSGRRYRGSNPCLPATHESAVLLMNSAVLRRTKFSQPFCSLASFFLEYSRDWRAYWPRVIFAGDIAPPNPPSVADSSSVQNRPLSPRLNRNRLWACRPGMLGSTFSQDET
jgi:hypothetical protein